MIKQRNVSIGVGIIALLGGVVIIVGVTGLKLVFGYPEIIRAEPGIILQKLYSTINIVPYLYYVGVGGAGICMVLFSVLFAYLLKDSGEEVWSSLGKVCGIIAGILLYVGIIRYSILFPKLSIMRQSGLYDNATIDLIFKAMNTYIGDSLAEHVQFTFSGFMFLFFGISILKTNIIPKWIGLLALVTTVVIIIGNLEQFGVKFAFIFNRTAAQMLSAWLIIAGIALILKKSTNTKSTIFENKSGTTK